jgi:hypothetical protein
MPGMPQRAFAALSFALVCIALPASAQETVRIRGTIEKVDGPIFVVKNRDGAEYKLTVTDNPLFVAISPSKTADIKPGMFVGSAGTMQPDGTQKAIEVHIFPESMRGTGEGHRPFTTPGSTMTNGTSAGATVTGVDGAAIKVKYKDGEKTIVVPPNVPIVRYEIGSPADLKTGVAFTVTAATKKPDGSLEAARINVGRDGVVPQ